MKHFTKDGHLDGNGIALYADALRKDRVEWLPTAVRRHVNGCAHCLHAAVEVYQIAAQTDYSDLPTHPGLSARPARRARWRWITALFFLGALVALWWMIGRVNYRTFAPAGAPVDTTLQAPPPSLPDTPPTDSAVLAPDSLR